MKNKKKNDIVVQSLYLIGCILLCLSAGAIGSYFTYPAIPTWYNGLVKSPINPPNWLFGPVWTFLYILMGVSLFLVITSSTKIKYKKALIWFGIQLVLNTGWSLIFFGCHQIIWAYLEIIVLEIAIVITALKFYRLNKIAGLLWIPYICWVAFASVLNLWLWFLNR
jgi:benzodiazapine receptor